MSGCCCCCCLVAGNFVGCPRRVSLSLSISRTRETLTDTHRRGREIERDASLATHTHTHTTSPYRPSFVVAAAAAFIVVDVDVVVDRPTHGDTENTRQRQPFTIDAEYPSYCCINTRTLPLRLSSPLFVFFFCENFLPPQIPQFVST